MSAAIRLPAGSPIAAVIQLDRCFGCGLEVIGMQIPGSPICFDCHQRAVSFAAEHRVRLIAWRCGNGEWSFEWVRSLPHPDVVDPVELAR